VQSPISYNKFITVATHVLAWTVFGLAIYYYQPIVSDVEIPWLFWVKQTLQLGMMVAIFYVNFALLVPRFLLRGHRIYYLAIVAGLVFGVVFLHRALDKAYGSVQMSRKLESMGLSRPPGPPVIFPSRRGLSGSMLTLAMTVMVVGVSTALAAVDRSQKDRQAREALEKDKAVTELSFLKNQINPHFYFNTLNNIYVLTELDPKLAGEAILQLSKMMRYLLYDTQRENTLLSQEIAFVRHYIGLMKLRLTERVKIVVETPEELEDMPLAPLILLPFIENAFKHGVSATQPSQISIRIEQVGKMLDLTVHNRIMNDHSLSLDTGSGIGLANTRRRLELLYPDKHTLKIDERDADDLYSVRLNLDLS